MYSIPTSDVLHGGPGVDDDPHQSVDGHLHEEGGGLHEEKGEGPEEDETHEDDQELETSGSPLGHGTLLLKLLLHFLDALQRRAPVGNLERNNNKALTNAHNNNNNNNNDNNEL